LSRRLPIKDIDGSSSPSYVGFNIDITVLDELRSELSRAERLANLGRVAAGIAHEIRNPLIGMGSTASLLLEKFPVSDPRYPKLAVILRETKRARQDCQSDHRLCAPARPGSWPGYVHRPCPGNTETVGPSDQQQTH
jgi:signal transduction histidine kinase